MSGIDQNKVENRLQRIANVLLLNASFTDNLGLLNGKMGIAIFFYQYARYTGNKVYEDYAGELIDQVQLEITKNTPVNFLNGLTGIGWAIEYLVDKSFVVANTDDIMLEIDKSVYRDSLYRPILLDGSKDFFGFGHYYIARLKGQEDDDVNLKALFKKQHIIYLIDDCEKILVEKRYLDYNREPLSIDTINSFCWFMLEVHRIGLFPVKTKKIITCLLNDYLGELLRNSGDLQGQLILKILGNRMISLKSNKQIDINLKKLLEKDNETLFDLEIQDYILINSFIKYTWQLLVYAPYINRNDKYSFLGEKVFQIIDNETNWNNRIDGLNNENIGLTGLAGLALGILECLKLKKE